MAILSCVMCGGKRGGKLSVCLACHAANERTRRQLNKLKPAKPIVTTRTRYKRKHGLWDGL